MLKGLVRCKECNHTIGFRIQKSKTSSGIKMRIYGNCNYYLKHRNSNACYPHSVKYEELENIIINYKIVKEYDMKNEGTYLVELR